MTIQNKAPRMLTLALVTALMTATGCATVGSLKAVQEEVGPLMTIHAAALAGDDVNLMRSTGRDLIATWDATAGGPR